LQTVVVSNRKGGSAKTTTAVNLAAYLSNKHRVLLIDFDTQGHSSLGVGCGCVEERGIHSIFLGEPLSFTFIPTPIKNLTLSPANEFFDVYGYPNLDWVLKQRFRDEKIDDYFDYCIIDTPPTYDTLLKNALSVANCVVIPVVPHYLGTVGVSQMIRAIYQMSMKSGNEIEFVGILPVMYNAHIKEHDIVLNELRKQFGEDRFFEPIRIDIEIASSFTEQKPIVTKNVRLRGSKDYKNFADNLIKKLKKG
jgi:chromosome partitioning protein